MPEEIEPIAVKFPLSGQWCAVNTPAHKVPSHGTDWIGQTYAYDFLQIDWHIKGYKYHTKSLLCSLIFGIQLDDTYCWSKPIYAPFDGRVVEVRDGLEERNPVHIVRDIAVVLWNSLFFRGERNEELQPILGNFVIIKKTDGIYCLIAHARNNSIVVSKGQQVKEGQQIAQVGHSGNSTTPHLHFQLMDRQNLVDAKGIPCCFKNYEVYSQGSWKSVKDNIPGRRERIRANNYDG